VVKIEGPTLFDSNGSAILQFQYNKFGSLTETVEQFATSRSIRAGSALNYECLFLALNVIPEGGKLSGYDNNDNSPDRPSNLLVR
jgi:hypothetical protein